MSGGNPEKNNLGDPPGTRQRRTAQTNKRAVTEPPRTKWDHRDELRSAVPATPNHRPTETK